jgi:hypothetical protein
MLCEMSKPEDADPSAPSAPESRAKRLDPHRHFATVQVTLLSIVVALILENLLAHIWASGAPGFITLEDWITWFQIALVLASALTTWSGFAFGLIFVENKQIHAIDFIVPFALLISMQVGIRYIFPEPIHGYLFAMALASGTAAALLISEYRSHRQSSRQSTFFAASVQMGITVWELLGALLLYVEWIDLPVALLFLVGATIVQTTALWATFAGWRAASAIATDSFTPH